MLSRVARGVVQKVMPIGRMTALRSFAAAKSGGDEYNPWDELNNDMKTLAPPIELDGDFAQYANTAFVQGNGAKALDAIEQDLAVVTNVIGEGTAQQFFQDPSVSVAEKQEALDAIAAEGKLHEISAAILALLNDDGRVAQIAEVNSAFSQLMSAQRGEVRATVTSAEELSAADAKAIKAALTKRLKKGQSLLFDTVVDAHIMGGLLVEFGNEFADLSVRSSVEDINQALRE